MAFSMAILMATPRLLGLHLVLPMFTDGNIPPRIRTGLTLSLGIFLIPVILSQGPPPPLGLTFALVACKELFLGFAFGFPFALMLFAAQSAGDLISSASGASMASAFDPASHDEISPTGNMLRQYCQVLFFISGTYTLLLEALFESYRLWPVASFYPVMGQDGINFFIAVFGQFTSSIMLLAFPALTVIFLVNISLAFISRYVPQVNVFFLAMPINSLAAVFVITLSLPIYAHLFNAKFVKTGDLLLAIHRAFTGG